MRVISRLARHRCPPYRLPAPVLRLKLEHMGK
nr:MAG TPA: hypothetical protein [Caudoviricetes sp.]